MDAVTEQKIELPVLRQTRGGVYFVASENRRSVKIGYASDFAERFTAAQTWFTSELCVLGVIRSNDPKLERRIHRQFKQFRIRGEWFVMSDALREYVQANATIYTYEPRDTGWLEEAFRNVARSRRIVIKNAPDTPSKAGLLNAIEQVERWLEKVKKEIV